MAAGRAIRNAGAIALVVSAHAASANTVTLDNGITGSGDLDLTMDDYGSFGRWVGPNDCDNFQPPNYQRPDPMTNVAENLLFIRAAGHTGGVALTGYNILYRLLEGSQGDGLEGDFANLTRTVTTPIALAGGIAASKIVVADTASGVKLDIGLVSQLVAQPPPVTRLDHEYTVSNSGTVDVTLTWHAVWDMNVIYSSASADDDFVGVGKGLCYVYMHDPGSTSMGGSFTDGGSEVGVVGALVPLPRSGYYGAKEGWPGVTPPFAVSTSVVSAQYVWSNFGMPASWHDVVADVGKDVAGESNMTTAPTQVGMEYQFVLAPGQEAIIRLHRYYGTIALPCSTAGVNCGNGVVDSGEACDSATDTATCNAGLCTAPMCGDNYVNTMAGEQCESNGVDSMDCNATTCTVPACGDGYTNAAVGEACDDGEDSATCNAANCQPAACGDGIVNAVAGEECEGGELCDAATCTVVFSVGGGCAGCGSAGGGGSLLWICGALFLAGRRRRGGATVEDEDSI